MSIDFMADKQLPLFSVGQVASLLDVQPAFLRRLDSEEVVQPCRTSGGQRRYSQNQVHEVQRVLGLTSEGLTLAAVKRLLILEAEVEILKSQLAFYKGQRN